MSITLSGLTFDEANTAAREKLEEVGGRDERRITISGLIAGLSDVESIEARLDEILDAASFPAYTAELSLRPGRRLWVQRENFRREVRPEERVGAFTLELSALTVFEESLAISVVDWPIAASGATIGVATAGTRFAEPQILLLALDTIVDPAISDGDRTLAYAGTLNDGDLLAFDGVTKQVLLNGADALPYTTGEFPRIAPEGTTLTYTDDAASSHAVGATISYRDRWW